MGDTITFNTTRRLRERWGWNDVVDFHSSAYTLGRWAGIAWWIMTPYAALRYFAQSSVAFQNWLMLGAEYDKYYFMLSSGNQYYYMLGQMTFSSATWFTTVSTARAAFYAGKIGPAGYVFATVMFGRWVQTTFPFRSIPFLNIVEFFTGIWKTLGTGPDPASRTLIRWLLGI
jgi:hypothetical protein